MDLKKILNVSDSYQIPDRLMEIIYNKEMGHVNLTRVVV